MLRKVIVLYGPPGSGKSTQANLIADKLHLIHFDTGRFLEMTVNDPARQKSKIIQRERKFFNAGTLLTPSFVFKEEKREIERYATAGRGLILSGSPRTLPEAKVLVPFLHQLYGREKIYVVELKIQPNASVKRNAKRYVCRVCAAPILMEFYPSKHPKHCPRCGGPLYRRSVDTPKAIVERLNQYRMRTEPVLDYFKKHNFRIYEMNAHLPPYQVLQRILHAVK